MQLCFCYKEPRFCSLQELNFTHKKTWCTTYLHSRDGTIGHHGRGHCLMLSPTVGLSLSSCRLSGLKGPELLHMAALELFNTQLFCLSVLYAALELFIPGCPWFSWCFWKVKTAAVFKVHKTQIHGSISCINGNCGIAFCIGLWFWKQSELGTDRDYLLEDTLGIQYSKWRKGDSF